MKSIRGKVFVAILLITLITSTAITAVFYQKSAALIEENYVSTLRQRGDQLIGTMDQMTQDIYHINVSASCDEDLKTSVEECIKQGDDQELETMAGILTSYRRESSFLSSMYLLIPAREVLVTSEDYPMYRKGIGQTDTDTVAGLAQTKSGPVIMDDMVHKGEVLFSFIESVEDENGETVAYLMSNIKERLLYYHYMDGLSGAEMEEAVILDEDNRIVTMLGDTAMGMDYEAVGSYSPWLSGTHVPAAEKDVIHVYSQTVFSKCSLYLTVEKAVVLKELRDMRSYFFGILAVLMLLSFIPAFYLTRLISKPVKKLASAMQKVSEGDLETRAEVVSNDEIGTLAAEFNQMLLRIEQLIHQLIEEENLKKDAELEALQYQITPHFMYNTLNSIKYAALIKGDKELGGLIGDFVELLQASISKKGAFLTVAEEIHVLENYIRLQEFRYGGHFSVHYDVSPDSESLLIPRLLLQPLVENALLHGMDIKEKDGELRISAAREGGALILKVSDHGRGMSQDQIAELLTSKVKKTKGLTAIGIPNIRDRLRLYYGETAEITFDSGEQGTTAVIRLPAQNMDEPGV